MRKIVSYRLGEVTPRLFRDGCWVSLAQIKKTNNHKEQIPSARPVPRMVRRANEVLYVLALHNSSCYLMQFRRFPPLL